ncbi:hypothetical protein OG985_21615 [Streptomyces sp. NBC_00289]|uniref:hypothetical protein n=1 Tax=Streptomyces sp. NBC_00289 TaxID=2975703 RepID=UPI003255E0EC
MSPNEIQMLIVGIAFGAHCMNITHIVLDARAARRSAAASRGVRRLAAGEQFLSSFRLYRMQHRSRA